MAEIINKADQSLGGWWWLLPGWTAFFCGVSQHDFMLVSMSGGGLADDVSIMTWWDTLHGTILRK